MRPHAALTHMGESLLRKKKKTGRGGIDAALTTYTVMEPAAFSAQSLAGALSCDKPADCVGVAALDATAASLQARDHYLAKQIDACTLEHQGAGIVCLFGPTATDGTGVAAGTRSRATVHGIIAREYCLFDCGLVYLPMIPGTLGHETLEVLLDNLMSWLRPRGELILCAFNALPAPALPQPVANAHPSARTPEQLLGLVRDIEGVTASVQRDHANNLAYLHVRRH